MKYCINCGQELADEAKFCANCGKAVNSNSTQRKTVYDSEIHKCPNCGEILESFAPNCPSCGFEMRGTSIQTFVDKLQHLKGEERITLIKSHPISNTKEEILEFMLLASSNITKEADVHIVEAWKIKFDQCYQKATLMFSNDVDFKKFQNIYEQTHKKIKTNKQYHETQNLKKNLSEISPHFPTIFTIVGWLISLFILIPLCGINQDNVGFNAFQLILLLDFIAGAIFIPNTLKNGYSLPKIISTICLLLSIVILIPLCGTKQDSSGFSAYQLILIVNIIVLCIVFSRILKNNTNNDPTAKRKLGRIDYLIIIISIILCLSSYGICSLITNNTHSSKTEYDYLFDQYDELDMNYYDYIDIPQVCNPSDSDNKIETTDNFEETMNNETIVFGEHGFINQIPPKGTVPFEIVINYEKKLPSNCKTLAYMW